MSSLQRRRFLKGAGASAATGALALAGLTPQTAAAKMPIPQHWDMTYDVVIIGYGGAGAAAAITAHDNGAKVLIIEKLAEGGGNTAVSSGGLFQPRDINAAKSYVEKLFDYSLAEYDKPLVDLYLEQSMNLVDWVKSLKPGTEMSVYGHAGFPDVKGSETVDKWSVSTGTSFGGGPKLWEVYTYAVETERAIPVLYNTPAKRLISDAQGEVIGVLVSKEGKDTYIKASRAVILTCGGYEYDQKMLQNFVKGSPIYALGSPGNTGDGIRMAQEVGAQLWHMNGASCPLGIKVEGFKSATTFTFQAPGYILVDRMAKRFINEKGIEHHAGLLAVDTYDGHALMYSRIPCYAIFDQKALEEAGALNGPSSSGYFRNKEQGGYRWSRSNQVELEKGWFVQAPDIKSLAQKVGLDPQSLDQTITKWNTDIKNGEDTLFHRDIENKLDASQAAYKDQHKKILSAPIEQGPFYAVEVVPTLLNTQGGPKKNLRAQVLNPFNEPIKRLYCAGELGSLWGIIYQGAGNNAESIVFGRIAGLNAAKEKPRE